MTRSSRAVASPRVVNIDDLRLLARRRVPRIVFNYIDGGAESEFTLRENLRAFEAVTFRPRQAVPVPSCDLRTRVLGFELSMPVLLAPVGYCRVMHPGGEMAAAKAAGAAGTAYILSTVSGHSLAGFASSSGPTGRPGKFSLTRFATAPRSTSSSPPPTPNPRCATATSPSCNCSTPAACAPANSAA